MPFEPGVDIIILTGSSSRARLRSSRLAIAWLLLQIILRLLYGGLQSSSLSSTLSGLRWFWCVKSGHCSRRLRSRWSRWNLPCIICLNDWRQSFSFLWYRSFLGLRCWRYTTTTLFHYTPHRFGSALCRDSRRGFRWSDWGVFRHLILSDIIGLIRLIVIRHEISLVDLLAEAWGW